MAQPQAQSRSNGSVERLSEMAAIAISPQMAACVRLISAHMGITYSQVYREAIACYVESIVSSEPGAGLAGQGDAELAAALRAALA